MQIGELFILRINIHLNGSILDSPELFWTEPRLEPVYMAVRSKWSSTNLGVLGLTIIFRLSGNGATGKTTNGSTGCHQRPPWSLEGSIESWPRRKARVDWYLPFDPHPIALSLTNSSDRSYRRRNHGSRREHFSGFVCRCGLSTSTA